MKAILQDRYGPISEVLRLAEIDKPAVGDGDVLVRVRAAGVNALDWHYVLGEPRVARLSMGRPAPKERRGVDVAGQVESVGKNVKNLRVGDEVFGWCAGAFAEYAAAPQDHFVLRPQLMTHEEAAAVPVAAVTALQGLRDFGKLQAGQRVLINGASGGVGTYGVQIAKAMGADVTGVCSGHNVEMVSSLGADRVMDYAKQDFTKEEQRYDVILDNAGNHSIGALSGVLVPGGILVYNSGASLQNLAMAQLRMRLGQKVRMYLARVTHPDLMALAGLIESGRLRSVIDRTYPLAETAAAIAYVAEGHARGKVVVTVG